ncbi:hypothetical protein ACOMHN_025673 [Nucella lapillus]
MTWNSNVSDSSSPFSCRNLFVPDDNLIMVSFKELNPVYSGIELKELPCDMGSFLNTTDVPIHTNPFIWKRQRDIHSDFVQLRNVRQVSLEVFVPNCVNTACFRLYFTFLPEDKKPEKLANGFWNCSVEHYASFHHHLACNLKTECEDGRDETGDCPYSSPHCNGLIVLCGRCYTVVTNVNDLSSFKTDVNKMGNDYCSSLGGRLGIPKCVYNWRQVIRHMTKIHPHRMNYLLTGLNTEDRLLPNMYVHAVVQEDKTVLHHSIEYILPDTYTSKLCLCTGQLSVVLGTLCVQSNKTFLSTYGVICEIAGNKTEENVDNSKIISLTRVEMLHSWEQQFLIKCPDDHVTRTFLLCGFNQYRICGQDFTHSCLFSHKDPQSNMFDSHDDGCVSTIPVFTCNDEKSRISYTQICDIVADCQDSSDESFCRNPPCVNEFQCFNGQCVSFDRVCDYMFHCQDQSDENVCKLFRVKAKHKQASFLPPVLVQFDGAIYFTSSTMNVSEPCPDSHFRCPGNFNDCLPVYTRCNLMYDCIGHEDEEGCEELTCPGFFRCRLSKLCLHSDHVCDGWSHCPMSDDELSCDIICPVNCLCQGYTFQCPQPFSASLFPQLRYLDVTGSGMTLHDVSNNTMLVGIVFAHCSLILLHKTQLVNLKYLDLSYNKLYTVNLAVFLGLENLQTLSLSNNPLTSISVGPPSDRQYSDLQALDLSFTTLAVLETRVFSVVPGLKKLNLTSTSIHTISLDGFQFTQHLTELFMDGSSVKTFQSDIFKDLSSLRYISTQNYKLCCSEILPYNFDQSNCIAARDEISSCEDLLQSWTYRGFLGLIACLSLMGNAACCCARFFASSLASSSGFSVFVTNLTVADFFMGVYIAIIGVADHQFRGKYLYNDDMWKNSATCKGAGFLSLLSSEVSALIIWFITLDRFIVLHFPFSTVRFDKTSAAVASLFIWLAGFLLAVLPLLPITSHWQFYSQTGICIPLPVTRREFKGRVYSFSVLIILNFIVFLFISAGQAFIYWSIQANALKMDSTKVSRDMTIARRLVTIAVTDFMCWFPIGLCGMLALAGIPIPGEVNVALAVFVLPLNSAANPFMYTFNTLAEKRRKTNEAKLLSWLESHSDLVGN